MLKTNGRKMLMIISIVAIFLAVTIAIHYFLYIEWKNQQPYKIEVYESESQWHYEVLRISYYEDGSINFQLGRKGKNGGFGSGADQVDDNTWIYDGAYSLPESSVYYKFVVYDEKTSDDGTAYLELYDRESLLMRFNLITSCVV